MKLTKQLNRQRVKYIVSTYQLAGDETDAFQQYLEVLFTQYPTPLIELALVETLVDRWLTVPLLRGCEFLVQVQAQLQRWEKAISDCDVEARITSTIAPEHFYQITGLDPSPIFGPAAIPRNKVPNS